jgi:agmatine deiminase
MNRLPKDLGYYFPAEWHKHTSTWLSWPHNSETWPGDKLKAIYPAYAEFIKIVARGELVNINVEDEKLENIAREVLSKYGVDFANIRFHHFKSNDSWCRDHGPAFLTNPKAEQKKLILDWGYNAWGGKYPPYIDDDIIPSKIGEKLNLPVISPGIIMEGGAVEFNGKGTVLTTTNCLLNKNRNPHLSKEEIEQYLINYYGVSNVLWLGDGIVGDDTDGHIDDITRFVNEDTVVTVMETSASDVNYQPLKENREALEKMKLENGKNLNIVELPMPKAFYTDNERLPASYANFYIANSAVVVPVFEDKNDDKALDILSGLFKDREVVGVNSKDIIWGLGSWHCLSQQEPEI